MGISSLLPSLRSIVRTKHVGEAYGGKRVAVDSYCWLHRGAYSCSVELVEGIPTDKFVTSFMKRAHMLRRCDVEAVYVFDGGRMPGKADEEADRRRARVEAKHKARAHKRAGNDVAANEMYQRAVDVSPEMALAVIHALKKDGFSTVVAPYEADAQMAYLVRHGFVDGVVTEDSDLVPHRCASVFFKMDNDGMGQEIRYADVTANRDLSFAGFTPDQFLEMCVMSGCDYLPSLPGVGIKKAHALMRRFKRHDAALRSLRFEGTPVPRKYEQGFKDALSVFKHQWVFCPVRGEMAHLSSAPPSAEENARASDASDANDADDPPLSREDAERLIGPRHPADAARGVAEGELHPMTLEAYAPLLLQRPDSLCLNVSPARWSPQEYGRMLKAGEYPFSLCGFAPHGVVLHERPRDPKLLPGLAEASRPVFVQDSVQQWGIAQLPPLGAASRVLDACAAPGGKSRALLHHAPHRCMPEGHLARSPCSRGRSGLRCWGGGRATGQRRRGHQ